MPTTLRDFIAMRETEIRDQQRALKVELRDLMVAKTALDAQSGGSGAAPTPPAPAPPTIKDMAREILAGQPNGLNSSGILDGIKKVFGREIERTSLSPQLSRLKDEGELVLEGDVWFTKANFSFGVPLPAPAATSRPAVFDSDLDDDVPF